MGLRSHSCPPKNHVPEADIRFELFDSLMAAYALDVAVGFRREKDPVTLFECDSVQAKIGALDPNMVCQWVALLVHDIHQDGDFLVVCCSADATEVGTIGVAGERSSEVSHNASLFLGSWYKSTLPFSMAKVKKRGRGPPRPFRHYAAWRWNEIVLRSPSLVG